MQSLLSKHTHLHLNQSHELLTNKERRRYLVAPIHQPEHKLNMIMSEETTLRPDSPASTVGSSGSRSTSSRRSKSSTTSKRCLDGSDTSNGTRHRRRRRKPSNDKEKNEVKDKSTRRVTFEVDEKNRVKRHVRKIKKNGEQGLWWSQDELEQIMEREQNVFEVFSKCCTSYVDSVLKLWDQCETEQGPTAMEVEKLANAPARGMENDVVVSFVPGSRDKAVQSVMNTQRAMSRCTLDVRTSTMRRRYTKLSKTSAEFAKIIAEGDARVAAAILAQ